MLVGHGIPRGAPARVGWLLSDAHDTPVVALFT
jgi:hypothetical protein